MQQQQAKQKKDQEEAEAEERLRLEAAAAEHARTHQKRERKHLASTEPVHIEEAGDPDLNISPGTEVTAMQMVRLLQQCESCYAPATMLCQHARLRLFSVKAKHRAPACRACPLQQPQGLLASLTTMQSSYQCKSLEQILPLVRSRSDCPALMVIGCLAGQCSVQTQASVTWPSVFSVSDVNCCRTECSVSRSLADLADEVSRHIGPSRNYSIKMEHNGLREGAQHEGQVRKTPPEDAAIKVSCMDCLLMHVLTLIALGQCWWPASA
jgi:hypothetical protein